MPSPRLPGHPATDVGQDGQMTTLARQIASSSAPGWRLALQRLHLRVKTGDFATGLDLVNAIGALAEAADHHPDIDLRYGTVAVVEIAIDAMDIAAIKPFWAAVLGWPADADEVADPATSGPTVWFQQMDEPRPQRNRIHLDVTVAHDEADARVAAALAAGGTLVSDSRAPSFWILADAEGNEACICTWQARE